MYALSCYFTESSQKTCVAEFTNDSLTMAGDTIETQG